MLVGVAFADDTDLKQRCKHVAYAFYVLIVRTPSVSIEERSYSDRDINRIKHGIT